jgi:hypothetical protein
MGEQAQAVCVRCVGAWEDNRATRDSSSIPTPTSLPSVPVGRKAESSALPLPPCPIPRPAFAPAHTKIVAVITTLFLLQPAPLTRAGKQGGLNCQA